jgi:hypothetical protein
MGKRRTRAAERREFIPRAQDLLRQANLPTADLSRHGRLTTCLVHTESDDCLAVTVSAAEGEGADAALASGLGRAGDRKLVLVLPEEQAQATLHRAAWLRAPLEIFTHDGAKVSAAVIPSRSEVLARYKDKLAIRKHHLGDRDGWVAPLRAWISDHPDIAYAPRCAYQSWLFLGRSVLRIKRIRGALQIEAGVDYSRPRNDQRVPTTFNITGPIDLGTRHLLQEAVVHAIAERREGRDPKSAEHRLQAALAAANPSGNLFTTIREREFPAIRWKGNRRLRGYIDLLGVAPSPPTINIIETKLGHDDMLVLQGLDYYIWAEAHRETLTSYLGLSGNTPIQIDYLTDAKSLHPDVWPQLSALARDVRYQFHHAAGWGDNLQVSLLDPHLLQ